MKIAMNTGTLLQHYDMFEAVTRVKEAGFDAIDFSVQTVLSKPDWSPENYQETALRLREHAAKEGITMGQAHAGGDVQRSMHIAALCGIPSIVIHPKIVMPHVGQEDKIFDINMEHYERFVPYAEEYGIKIAVENMFKWDWTREMIWHSCCSRPDEFVRYMDGLEKRFGKENFTACLDVGHSVLVGEDPCNTIRALGGERLTSLHMHDNNFHQDMHTIINAGKMDFIAISKALKEINYQGDYALEVGLHYPKDLVPEAMRHLAVVCRYYADLASN